MEVHCIWQDLGRIRFEEANLLQETAWKAVVKHPERRAFIITFEPDPVITFGRHANFSDLLVTPQKLSAASIDIQRVDRGGNMTYHGPGQLVIYLIFPVLYLKLGTRELIKRLSFSIQKVLRSFGVDVFYDDKRPGLWADKGKICAFGMRIQNGVSKHGGALNIKTDLSAYSLFIPCGLQEAKTTSLHEYIKTPISYKEITSLIVKEIIEQFQMILEVP